MIVKMKKVSLILLESARAEALETLGKLGVVHIEKQVVPSDTLSHLNETMSSIERAMYLIPSKKKKERTELSLQLSANDVVKRVLALDEEKRSLQDDIDRNAKDRERASVWGEFEPALVEEIRQKGVTVRFYEANKEQWKEIEQQRNATVFPVTKTKSIVFFVAVFVGDQEPLNASEVQIPSRSVSFIDRENEAKRARMEAIEEELSGYIPYRQMLKAEKKSIEDRIEYEEARLSFGTEERLAFLTGYVPEPKIEELKKTASENRWGLLVKEPEEGDMVPTLTKNPRWVEIIQPVFGFLGTVPGYKEVDISFFFLAFFSVFVAMIISDGGYGALVFITCIVAIIRTKTKGKKISQSILLFLFLSICTIVWGAITGSWFGSAAIASSPAFSWMIVPALASSNPQSSELVRIICFIIGTVQLSIAHIWNFIREVRQKPLIKSFAQLGSLSMVLGLFYFVLNIVLDAKKYPMPSYALYMVLGGFVFVLVFAKQEGKFLRGILKGFANLITTFLNSISVFADIISYIRLFAVGLAGAQISKSFNDMASGAFGMGAVGIIGGILILLIGHSMNIAMSGLSVVVHGIRLNMLEFSGHLGMEWSGTQYKPFKTHTRAS